MKVVVKAYIENILYNINIILSNIKKNYLSYFIQLKNLNLLDNNEEIVINKNIQELVYNNNLLT